MDDSTDDFRALLGSFNVKGDITKRAKAERRAMLAPSDRRRAKGPRRDHQMNVRVRKATADLAKKLCERDDISLADLLEALIEARAKERGVA